jgi:ATP-dependent protease ClpP protease subunit
VRGIGGASAGPDRDYILQAHDAVEYDLVDQVIAKRD